MPFQMRIILVCSCGRSIMFAWDGVSTKPSFLTCRNCGQTHPIGEALLSAKNPCSKQVTPETAYEVYRTLNGDFTTYVLKKYKSPEQEAQDPYAAWHVATQSPSTMGSLEYGDTYAIEVKRSMILVDNPLCSYICLTSVTPEQLRALGIRPYQQTALVEKLSTLTGYYRVAVPKNKLRTFHNRLGEFLYVRIVCQDAANYMLICERDAESGKE